MTFPPAIIAANKSANGAACGNSNSCAFPGSANQDASPVSQSDVEIPDATAVAATGLITFDAHYDLRDGVSNGSPVRRLIESGLSGKNVVQIGIADFSNSPEYAARARELGITVIHRSELRGASLDQVWKRAVKVAGSRIHIDFDMDICDRSVVPACPAAAPGGISADEIRQFAFLAGGSEEVVSVDITEIDVAKDSSDERTVRLAALVVLEVAAGLSTRI